MDICARDLKNLVVFERPANVSDDMGGITDDWTSICEAWAKVEPASGKEKLHAAALKCVNPYVLTIRFDSDFKLDNSMRVKVEDGYGKTLVLNVRSVTDVEFKHEWLTILADEGVGT